MVASTLYTDVIMPKYLPEVDLYTNIRNNGISAAYFTVMKIQNVSL